ncbi:TPA: hypothetical protein N0F65_003502 [Lagenidium giganteum]|uniref:Uncharacterized protein n=1 Tax=Lagenidium giganteum TaxID=4803 RepID=A0AAV2YKN5_9STRA|nr:TPA: hypothetical protein N0F65_003502 [Lagenidium giganteum]
MNVEQTTASVNAVQFRRQLTPAWAGKESVGSASDRGRAGRKPADRAADKPGSAAEKTDQPPQDLRNGRMAKTQDE